MCVNSARAAFEKRPTLDLRWIPMYICYVCCRVLQGVEVRSQVDIYTCVLQVLQCVAVCCSVL